MPLKTIVIAEIGVNHNGSVDNALKLVDAAVLAGADIAKFQSFQAKSLVTRDAQKAEYQVRETGNSSQYDMLKALELNIEAHQRILSHCQDQNIGFLSTPFDHDSLSMLVEQLGQSLIKVGSGDLTNAPLLFDIAKRNCDVILSTGMANLTEIQKALGILACGFIDGQNLNTEGFMQAFRSEEGMTRIKQKVKILHCTTEYPAPLASINLRAMDTLKEVFDLPVGFSDHSEGSSASIAAVARGACIIEKHMTLDRGMSGPDHAASMEPKPFAEMVRDIREVELCMGKREKRPNSVELANMIIARKVLVANAPIAKGEILTIDNLTTKRAGVGVCALLYFDMIGQKASQNYHVDESIVP